MDKRRLIFGVISFFVLSAMAGAVDPVKIGLNYPETGPYAKQGLDQKRAAELAVSEMNSAGGILGRPVELVLRDDKNKPAVTKENVSDLFDNEGVEMVLGGSSSAVAIAAGKVARAKKKLFFGTLTYSTDTTGIEGNRYTFRECSDSGMAAKVVGAYLKKNFAGKKYYYISADYPWGWTTEELFRKETDTLDKSINLSSLTKLGATDFSSVLQMASEEKPDVLVLVLFGRDLEIALKQAYDIGLTRKLQIVVPNLTEDMIEDASFEAAEGVIGSTPWFAQLAIDRKYAQGQKFIEDFFAKYNRYPTTSGASAYVILKEYKAAVERAKTFDSQAVIKQLEDYKYIGLKDSQKWRAFDHQSIQTVYAVEVKPAAEVTKDLDKLNCYDIVGEMTGEQCAVSKSDWQAERAKVGAPSEITD